MLDPVLLISSLLAIYLAWNLGANDVANSMGTSVGSKAVTLRQALTIAGLLEFSGAVLFGRSVSQKLATGILDPSQFSASPQVFLLGMIAVLVAAGIWLNLATLLGLPVSSSHATVGALAGVGWVAIGAQAVDWTVLTTISITWVLTPVVSGLIAAMFYQVINWGLLHRSDVLDRLPYWIPGLSVALMGLFGVIVFPSFSQPIQHWLSDRGQISLPETAIPWGLGLVGTAALTTYHWQQFSTQIRTSATAPANIPEAHIPEAHIPEAVMARFQVLSACFVAFAHGSNDVGNAIAPFATIVHIRHYGTLPLRDFSIPLWVLMLGGLGIVGGLAVLGKNVITTIGENIISLQPSGGFCAELATATTVLLASRLGLPVSTSHALVGGVVGIGLAQGLKSVQWKTLRTIGLTWMATIPAATGLGAIVFVILRWQFAKFGLN